MAVGLVFGCMLHNTEERGTAPSHKTLTKDEWEIYMTLDYRGVWGRAMSDDSLRYLLCGYYIALLNGFYIAYYPNSSLFLNCLSDGWTGDLYVYCLAHELLSKHYSLCQVLKIELTLVRYWPDNCEIAFSSCV